MSRFGRAAKVVNDSPLVIPLFFVFLTMLVVALFTSYEDYTTSRLGYEMLPTRKANPGVIFAVALIPQIGQVGFSYAWGREWKVNRQLAFVSLITALGLHAIDVGTDVYFKSAGQPAHVWVLSLIEAEFIYTLGSEIMLVVSFGMLSQLLPEFLEQVQSLVEKISQALDKLDGEGTDSWSSEPSYSSLGDNADDWD